MTGPHEGFQSGYRSPNGVGWTALAAFAVASLGWVLSALADWYRHAAVAALEAGEADIDFAELASAADYVRLAGLVTLFAQIGAVLAYAAWYAVMRGNCEVVVGADRHEKRKRRRTTEAWRLSDPRPGAVRTGLVAAWQWSFAAALWTYLASSVFRSPETSAADFRTTALITTAIAVLLVLSTCFAVPVVRGISRAQSDPANLSA